MLSLIRSGSGSRECCPSLIEMAGFDQGGRGVCPPADTLRSACPSASGAAPPVSYQAASTTLEPITKFGDLLNKELHHISSPKPNGCERLTFSGSSFDPYAFRARGLGGLPSDATHLRVEDRWRQILAERPKKLLRGSQWDRQPRLPRAWVAQVV